MPAPRERPRDRRGGALLAAIGIISAPEFQQRRDAIRATWLASTPDRLVAKFVVRSRLCNSTRRWAAATVEVREDVLPVTTVCREEPRSRGVVLTIHAWLQHAAKAYTEAAFIVRTDDDVWIDLVSLQLYLGVVAAHGATHVLMGRTFYTSWLHEGLRERDVGFGYNCVTAYKASKRYLRNKTVSKTQNNGGVSFGPYIFTPGYLTILSLSLAATIAKSDTLLQRLREVQSGGGQFAVDDKWLGSALHRHASREPVTYVNMYMTALTTDTFGVEARSSTILWHNRVKDPARLGYLQNFSQLHGCLAPAERLRAAMNATLWTPKLTCTSKPVGCAPPKSTMCTVSPLCEPRHYRLKFSDKSWIRS